MEENFCYNFFVLEFVLKCLYFFAPAGFANLAPVLAAHFNILKSTDKPIDAGKSFRGKRIFGDHKTYRGFIAGGFIAIITGLLQMALSGNDFFDQYSLVDYSKFENFFVLSLLLGIGALVGDAIKSFFKRQLGVQSGKSWFPFDQIDYILGAYIFSLFIVIIEFKFFAGILIIYFIIHLSVKAIGYFIGMNKDWI